LIRRKYIVYGQGLNDLEFAIEAAMNLLAIVADAATITIAALAVEAFSRK
jgi:hypothetical protein